MNYDLTPEQENAILAHANTFFRDEKNCSLFTKYFLMLLLASVSNNDGSFSSLNAFDDKANFPILNNFFKLLIHDHSDQNFPHYEDYIRVYDKCFKIKKNLFEILKNSEDKDSQFLCYVSWNIINMIHKGLRTTEIYSSLLSYIPREFDKYSDKLKQDISFPWFYESTRILNFYCQGYDHYNYIIGLKSDNVILLKSHNSDLMFLKDFYYYPLFYKYLIYGDFDKIPQDGFLQRSTAKYLLSVTTNQDGSFNFQTCNEENTDNCLAEKKFQPVFFTIKNGNLISRIKINNKEVWYSNDNQITVPINGSGSKICGEIITYKRNNIPYFFLNGKEYNGCPVYVPVQGFVYLENGRIEFQVYPFASKKMKHAPFYNKKGFKFLCNQIFNSLSLINFPIGAYFRQDPDRSLPAGEPVYAKAETKLCQIYKTTIQTFFKSSLLETKLKYKIFCSDTDSYIYFPEQKKYFTIPMKDFKANPKAMEKNLKDFISKIS